jgi:hypothetical protein
MSRTIVLCLGLVLLGAGWACKNNDLPEVPVFPTKNFPAVLAGCNVQGHNQVTSEDVKAPGVMHLSPVTLTGTGNISSIGVYLAAPVTGTIMLGVYDVTAVNYPNRLLASGTVSETSGWTVLSVGSVPITTMTAWVAYQPEFSSTVAYDNHDGTSASTTGYFKSNTFGSFIDPYPASSSYSNQAHFTSFVVVCP